MKIKGIKIATCNSGIRYKNRDDLLVLTFDKPATIAGVFTKSSIKGAPVIKSIANLMASKTAMGLVVNSGNSNVFTGKKGEEIVEKTASTLAQELNCDENQIYISSTGVIGEVFDYHLITDKIPTLVAKANESEENLAKAAKAIMTTDLAPKTVSATCQIDAKNVTIEGFAKGSGMIAPNMATMLGFIFTDANIQGDVLQQILSELNEESFNSITVDSDSSTSDTALLFATGDAQNEKITDINDPRLSDFKATLFEVMLDLAKKIVRDGEGAKKLVKINVEGASSKDQAKIVGLAIANSPLVKTALAAADPNWGRIAMAVGKSCPEANINNLKITIGKFTITQNGQLHPNYVEKDVHQYLKGDEIEITIDLGIETIQEANKKTIYTCDFNEEYVTINKDYRS